MGLNPFTPLVKFPIVYSSFAALTCADKSDLCSSILLAFLVPKPRRQKVQPLYLSRSQYTYGGQWQVRFSPLKVQIEPVVHAPHCLDRQRRSFHRIRIGAFFKMARAIAILCCSPPDKYTPFVPTTVSMPFGSFSIISRHCAVLRAWTISSQVALGFAIHTFSNMDALIRRLFWNTKDTLFISVSFFI